MIASLAVLTQKTDPLLDGASLVGEGLVLVVSCRGAAGSYPLRVGRTLVIGRGGEADVELEDATVSRHHAELEVGAELRLSDAGSRNGTFVDGDRLAFGEVRVLRVGEVVRIGQAVLVVQARGGVVAGAPPPREAPRPLRDEVAELERQHILDVLEACGGNQTRAARALGISRSTLNQRLDAYAVPRPRKKTSTRPF